MESVKFFCYSHPMESFEHVENKEAWQRETALKHEASVLARFRKNIGLGALALAFIGISNAACGTIHAETNVFGVGIKVEGGVTGEVYKRDPSKLPRHFDSDEARSHRRQK